MAYGPNRAAARPRAFFRTAGGTIFKFRHPMLAWQIDQASPVDEIDVSRALKLNETHFNAMPMIDHAFQELLVDGSTITVTNHSLAGSMTLQVLPTSGFVGIRGGDFIEAAHLIVASKDAEGGVFTVIEHVDGRRRITIYYGVSFKSVPHQIIAGNAVPVHSVVMNYSGWVRAIADNQDTEKVIWAVGNRYGIRAVYEPFGIQNGEGGGSGNFFSGSPISSDVTGVNAAHADNPEGDVEHLASDPDPSAYQVRGTPSTVTWD